MCLALLVIYWKKLDEHNAALENYQMALSLERAIDDRRGQAGTLLSIGNLQKLQHNYDAALVSYQESLTLYGAIDHGIAAAVILVDIGDAHRLNADYDAALNSYQQAIGLCRRIGFRTGEGNALTSLSLLNLICEDCESAQTHLEEAVAIFRTEGSRLEGMAYGNFASTLLDLGKRSDARSYALKAKAAIEHYADLSLMEWIDEIVAECE